MGIRAIVPDQAIDKQAESVEGCLNCCSLPRLPRPMPTGHLDQRPVHGRN